MHRRIGSGLVFALPCLATGAFAQSSRAHVQPYTPSLSLDWSARYDHGISGHDNATCVAIDTHGRTIACGSSLGHVGSSFVYEITTLSYSNAGSLLWERRLHGNGSGFNDTPVAVAIGPQDSVFVLGTVAGGGSDQDVALLKYDSAGNLQWSTTWNHYWSDGCSDLVVTPAGEVYVAASSYYTTNVTDVVMLKFDALGALVWEQNWHGGGGTDYPLDIQLDSQGNIALLGQTITAPIGTNYDWLIQKWSPNGVVLWTQRAGSAGTAPDYASALVLAPNDDILVTGHDFVAGQEFGKTQRYTTNGTLLWSRTLAPGLSGGDAITCDATGNVYEVTGPSVISYDPAGNLRWNVPFAGSGWASPVALDVRMLGAHLAVGGTTSFSAGQLAAAVYDLAGNVVATRSAGAPFTVGAITRCLATRPNGRLCLIGQSSNGHDQDFVTAAFTLN
ncbi:MAG: hypothetical protein IPJ19_20135 [Planctomycetes bacterium]|nr:hypothetical protein [Planctomycetota bacterium]